MAEAELQCAEIKLSVPWGHVAAKTYGPSVGKPVLLVHGRLDNADSFTRLMKYLPKESFYYVCIDLPGHGWSSPFPSWLMLNMSSYLHALYFILEALRWETCIYIGHSMGAQIGLMFSTLQPNRIRKLISFDGILLTTATTDFATYSKAASALSIKAYHNEKSMFFTKDEILHALRTKRLATLNSEAADAIFNRAVTKVNEKYIYNRDIRLKQHPFTHMKIDECQMFNSKLSIPIYLVVPSHGLIFPYKKYHKLVLETIRAKTILEAIYVKGNHDIHNNNPEKIAPFVCKVLNSDNFSKL